MNFLHSTLDRLRDTYAPLSNASTFRKTGQITAEEFLEAGDFLVYKFPSWSWADASSPAQRVAYLPAGKQYLVTRGVPCRRRLDENFAGGAAAEEELLGFAGREGEEEEGWTTAGGGGGGGERGRSGTERMREVRTLGDGGAVETVENEGDEEEIPDMEDEDDDEEAIIRDPKGEKSSPLRTYTLYITYTPYYRTPRLYLSGYSSPSPGATQIPLPPTSMMEDIVGDYKDKTVTLEDFLFLSPTVRTASVHPCRHASVMKILLDRADGALRRRKDRLLLKERGDGGGDAGGSVEGMVGATAGLKIGGQGKTDGDGWEVLGGGDGKGEEGGAEDDDDDDNDNNDNNSAIRVDQYLVVFLKFMASVTPGIEHDYTMGL